MLDRGRHSVLGVQVHAVDRETAVARIVEAARDRRQLGVSALAVHGVMCGVLDTDLNARIDQLELVVPDGQPVRWALNLLHKTELPERVYGPDLMLDVCREAAAAGLGVFLFGSTVETLERLASSLRERFPDLDIRGSQPSRFRSATEDERLQDVETIRASGARIVFVGLGCPRQEIWTWENRADLEMPVLAVGAAFDFHAGNQPQAPASLQRWGLEWAFRLLQEPGRLWRRYLFFNPLYLAGLFGQWTRLWRPSNRSEGRRPPAVRPG